MKCRQYSVKVFEISIEADDSFIDFIKANYELLKNHLLSIKGKISDDVAVFLDKNGLKYIHEMELPKPKKFENIRIVSVGASPEKSDSSRQHKLDDSRDSGEENHRPGPLKVVTGPLRSGQCIEYNGSVLLTGRINSGAKVAALGSVIAVGIIEGDISSAGECIIITPARKGNVLFHGIKIENEKLIYPLNKITFMGNDVHIQPIAKKEFT